jgi:hypothetical protein
MTLLRSFFNIDLLSSADFVVGALIVVIFQFSKMCEISRDRVLARSMPSGEAKKARNYSGLYWLSTIIVLSMLLMFLIFWFSCSAAPLVVKGWENVNKSSKDLEDIFKSNSYPLYMSAVFLGIAQFPLPKISSLSIIQRTFLHFCVGITRVVDYAAQDTAAGINSTKERSEEAWEKLNNVNPVSNHIDKQFFDDSQETLYRSHAVDGGTSGSDIPERHLKKINEELVFLLFVAGVRRRGFASFPFISKFLLDSKYNDSGVALEALNASIVKKTSLTYGGVLRGLFIFLSGFLGLVFLLPSISWLFSFGPTLLAFWPNTISSSLQYTSSVYLPFFASVWILLATLSEREEIRKISWLGIILASIFVVVFDLLQAFFDFGYFNNKGFAAGAAWFLFKFSVPFGLPRAIIYLLIIQLALFFVFSSKLKEGVLCYGVVFIASGLLFSAYFYICTKFQFTLNYPEGFILSNVILGVLTSLIVTRFTWVLYSLYAGKTPTTVVGRDMPAS